MHHMIYPHLLIIYSFSVTCNKESRSVDWASDRANHHIGIFLKLYTDDALSLYEYMSLGSFQICKTRSGVVSMYR